MLPPEVVIGTVAGVDELRTMLRASWPGQPGPCEPLTGGMNSQAFTVEYNGRGYRGTSVTTDIVESGVRAFLEVLNRIEASRQTAARTAADRRVSEIAPT